MASNPADRLRYPFKLRPLNDDVDERISNVFTARSSGLISVNQWDFKLPAMVTDADLEEVYNYPLDPRDVWLVSPPSCGNAWCQEMIWLLANDLDYDGAKCPLMPDRWNMVDLKLADYKRWLTDYEEKLRAEKSEHSVTLRSNNPYRASPKFVTSQLPISMNNPRLLETCKTFFVGRNPKDACLAFFDHCRTFRGLVCGLSTFARMYMAGEVLQTPVIPMMVEAWNLRRHPNLCLIFYEDLREDLPSQLTKMAAFLGKQYSSDEILGLAEHVHADIFQPNTLLSAEKELTDVTINGGEKHGNNYVDETNEVCSPELERQFQQWMDQQLMSSDLRFNSKM